MDPRMRLALSFNCITRLMLRKPGRLQNPVLEENGNLVRLFFAVFWYFVRLRAYKFMAL